MEYGEEVWMEILQEGGVKNTVFKTRQQYPDTLMTNLAMALAKKNCTSLDTTMHFFGKCFVRFFSNLGWDNIKLLTRINIFIFIYGKSIEK